MDDPEEQVRKALEPVIKRFARLHPIDLINTAKVLNAALHDAEADIAALRRQAVRQLRGDGWTLADIAAETDMTPPRVLQIERGMGRQEKAGKG